MNPEQLNEMLTEIIPQQLFHVMPTDKNPDGSRCDETILVGLLNSNPELLAHHRLEWYLNTYIKSFENPTNKNSDSEPVYKCFKIMGI